MQRFFLYLALGFLCIGGFAFYYYQPQLVVERNARKLFELASISETDSKTGRALRSFGFDDLIHDPVVISSSIARLDRTFDKAELSEQFKVYAQYIDHSSFSIESLDVELTGDTSARARFRAAGEVVSGEMNEQQLFSGYFDFIKTEDGWLLESALLDKTQ